MQIGARRAKTCMLCVHIPTELSILHATVGGRVVGHSMEHTMQGPSVQRIGSVMIGTQRIARRSDTVLAPHRTCPYKVSQHVWFYALLVGRVVVY